MTNELNIKEKMKRKATSKRNKAKSFNPNRQYLDSAMKEYLQKGGKVTKLEEAVEDDIERMLSQM